MHFQQYNLACLSHFSYLIGDDGEACVVDPRRDVDEYLRDAEARGLSIRHVILTHFHADFVAGHLELRERTGATLYMGKGADADYPITHVGDGDSLRMGSVRLDFLQTPGHTPEGISVVVTESDAAPYGVLTGDTLFLGDVGRPDLMASVGVTAEELASQMYDSLRQKLLPLPDATLVFPAHGAGSACGKNISGDSSSPLGVQRATNWALAPMEREEFVQRLTANLPSAPPYFSFDAQLNRRERPTLQSSIRAALSPLSVAEFLEARGRSQVVDARDPDDFARSHVRGSVNIGLDGRYASWAGTVLDLHRPVLLITDAGREQEAVVRLGRIGLDQIEGFLKGGIDSLRGLDCLTSTQRRTAQELDALLRDDRDLVVVDIRTRGERDLGTIEGSLHVPLEDFAVRMESIPQDRPVVLVCAGGYRSSIAASLMRNAGHPQVEDLRGGYAAWKLRQI